MSSNYLVQYSFEIRSSKKFINNTAIRNIRFRNSEFYGFSEFYYTMEDVLRMGGPYEYMKFQKAATEYCGTKWDTLQSWYEEKLYPKADERRFGLVRF